MSISVIIVVFSWNTVPRGKRNTLGTTYSHPQIFRGNTLLTRFGEFKYFTGIKLMEANASVGYYHNFYNCKNLEHIELPDSLTALGTGCFAFNVAMKEFNSNNITKLETWAFREAKIENVVLNEGCKTIEGSYGAFQNVTTLKYIDLPSTITAISSANNFRSSSPVIVCRATTPPTLANNNTASKAVYVPAESVDAYKAATNWSSHAARIHQIEGTWYETHRELEPS